jgi:hypothetical protein
MTRIRQHILVASCCGLLGCGTSTALKCTDSSVTIATLEVAKGQVRDLVLYDTLGRRVSLEVALTHPKYDEFKARTDAPYVKEVIAEVDQFLSSREFSIEAVRGQTSGKDAQSLSCAADFVMKGADGTKKFPITYSVQGADAGKAIQVEVHGL